jgi:putative selenate reductase
LSASVKGAGVEGLACAYFLARAGVAVTAYGPAPGADGRLLAGESGVADLASILAMGVRLGDGDAPAGAIEAMTPASGPAGLPSAVRRGRRRAEAFLASSLDALAPAAAQGAPLPGLQELFAAKARRDYGPDRVDSADAARIESARCLRCGEVCNVCVTVCPNRANMAIPWKLAGRPGSIPVQRAVRTPDGVRVETSGREGASQLFQIVNVADFCNECGNCASFCPSAGAPHRDKFRLHLHRASFESAGQGAWFSEPGRMEASLGGERMAVRSCAEQSGSARAAVVVESPRFSAILDASTLEAVSVTLAPGVEEASLALAARAGLLYNPLSDVVAVFWK